MQVRKTTRADYEEIAKIYAYARQFMKETGNPNQWGNSRPTEAAIFKDIDNGNSYVICEDDRICGVFTYFVGDDETYHVIKDGMWLNDKTYGVIHKIAAAEGAKGIMATAVAFAESKCNNIRIDTHRDNLVMQHLISKNGFQYCGIIYTDDGTERLAYQKEV